MEKGSVQRRGFDRALYIADRLNSGQWLYRAGI